jgi:hypothetical protein
MKKLFTLLVGVLLAGNAFGQELIINGDLEGEQQAGWSSFWVQDTKAEGVTDEATGQGQITHSDGVKGWLQFADIVQNPFKAGKCIKVHVADKAESDAMGTARMDGSTYVSWNTQFYLYLKEAVPEGKWITLQMKVRCEDREGSMDGQAHEKPNGYTHYTLFTNNTISYEKGKWNKIWRKAQISSSHTASGSKLFQAIAFNVASSSATESFDLYFDDISVVVSDDEPQEPVIEDNSGWVNFMRKGVFSEDPIDFVNYGSDEEPNMVKVSNFMLQVRDQETGQNILKKADVVETGDADHPYAVKVPTQDHYSQTVQIKDLDADGNEQFDEEGNVLMKDSTTYYWSDGSVIGTSAPARYSSQFFVSTLHKMKAGEKYKLVFWIKADKDAKIATQAHTLPTKYKDYNTFKWVDGSGTEQSEFPVTTEWTKFELGDPQGKTIPSGAAGCQTITFDTYLLQEANNYYFAFEECSFSEKNVTMADRTLGTPEDLALPVNTGDDPKATTVDMAGMLEAFEIEDFSFLNNGKDGITLLTLSKPENPEEDEPEEIFSSVLPWTDGGFLNAQGYFVDLDFMDGIQIYLDDESIDGSKINVNVWNNPDSGISFANGETLKSRLAISMGGWYYIYNITLGSQETIDQLAGIKGVKQAKADNGLIYNLAGQRVDASYKGLVIKNGQKSIQK